jgi:hypothetical protein
MKKSFDHCFAIAFSDKTAVNVDALLKLAAFVISNKKLSLISI